MFYLKTVVVLVGVFEEAVHGIEDFVGKQKEPFPEKLSQIQLATLKTNKTANSTEMNR